MYKNLLRFSILLLVSSIIFSLYVLLYLNNQNNIIIVEQNQYAKILDEVHKNPDKYIGKKFIVTGYVYIQEDFSDNRFVIAQNIYINKLSSTVPFIIGFLCENKSNINISPNETIQIEGILDKCIYNNSEYPILIVDKIK